VLYLRTVVPFGFFTEPKIAKPKSFAQAVDIFLKCLLAMLVPLDVLPHIIDSPFTRWLRSVHIFWWFFGTFVAWVGWKRLFCGGFAMAKPPCGKSDSDSTQGYPRAGE